MNSIYTNTKLPKKEYNYSIILLLILLVGQIFIIIAPILFSRNNMYIYFDESTGVIGDTIGGCTSPIIGSINIIIVYFALRTQMKANSLVQDQINFQYTIDNIKYLINFIESEIDSFKYSNKKGISAVNSIIEEISKNINLTDTEFYNFIESLFQTCLVCKNEISSIQNISLRKTHEFIFSKRVLERIQLKANLNIKDDRLKDLINKLNK